MRSMPRVEQIEDKETLKQIALLLERENDRLLDRIRRLTEENAQLRGEDASNVQLELEYLKELLAQRERVIFGEKSERRARPEDPAAKSETPAQGGHGPKSQPRLPIIEKVHELDVPDRICPVCGGGLEEWSGQTEDADEITVVERRFVIVKHRRKKYRCRCYGCVETAPAPPKLQPGGRYSPEFAVEVATGKYLDHLPLERQVRIMRREGLEIDSQTLWDQLNILARCLQPSYEALARHVLGSEVVGADETWWRLMESRGSKRWWAWSVTREDAVFYRVLASRSQEAARQVLNGYAGTVLADGYGAYEALARSGPGFKLAHCWSHVRRKFIEAEPHYPESCRQALDLIGKLYDVERTVPSMDTPTARKEMLDLRRGLRESRSRLIVAEIHSWAMGQKALPESSLGKAISYMLGMWNGLIRFLDDPRLPLDNNATERGLRGLVVGRKNHYGSRSLRGTEVAALFYSLIESAKLRGVDPKGYLLRATHAALANPGTPTLPQDLLS